MMENESSEIQVEKWDVKCTAYPNKRKTNTKKKPRKKNPQKKIKQFFKVTKRKVGHTEKNFQGFPMEECVFADDLGRFIWHPPVYGNTAPLKQDPLRYSMFARVTCKWCYLPPCICEEKNDEIWKFLDAIRETGLDDKADLVSIAESEAASLMVEVFGARYVRNNGIPPCIKEFIRQWSETDPDELLPPPGEDPDEELIANSIEGQEEHQRMFPNEDEN
jgi:hypothetical protein